ncbi:hypothetical protein GZH47_32775 (plasmid) [Paenibacillus rhizovicinus]|uniref:Uncharacterized protein n=1 Tax=Paenibacillus rhizovicinus TaxID=2704463 RepID=A0A6C0PAR9_9BACL|nr:hypothetical protein [Paenibacillus rhizovicinus]QHW35674.1 hypothetical protein GZH47_32775 [Paenibacillus rhizovicinus]
MPEIKVGLAPRKQSFYDPLTNTYLTLEKPVQTINVDGNTDLTKITHAVCCQPPALVLFEGDIPQTFIDAWKAKFDGMFSGKEKDRKKLDGTWDKHTPVFALDRADAVNANSANVVTAQAEGQADLFSVAAAVNTDDADKAAAEDAEAAAKAAEAAQAAEDAAKAQEADKASEATKDTGKAAGKGKAAAEK